MLNIPRQRLVYGASGAHFFAGNDQHAIFSDEPTIAHGACQPEVVGALYCLEYILQTIRPMLSSQRHHSKKRKRQRLSVK